MRSENRLAKLQGWVIAGMLIQFACGGGGASSSSPSQAPIQPASESVTLIGAPADLTVGDALPVTAQVQGSSGTAVTWTVDDIPNGNSDVGTITGSGNAVTYVAPQAEGTHVVVATSLVDPSKAASGQMRVHLRSTVSSVTVGPAVWSLNVGTQEQFTATVAGTGAYSSGITWSCLRGTITSGGLYTAPATAGADTVTATSVQDGSKKGTSTITVTPASVAPPTSSITSVSVSPATLTLAPSAQSSLTATVAGTGTFSYGVTWSCLHGTITSGGLYTAPSTAGSDTVTATSVQDGSKMGTSTVTVAATPVTPPPATGPVISAVTASSLTQTGATISWTLNEVGTGQVFYGLTTTYGSTTNPELSFNYSAHAQNIAGLTAGTLYHYCVKSADQAGNLTASGDYTFTTSPAAPNPPATSITSVAVSPTTSTLNTGAQTSFTVTVAGTGSYNSSVTWSCLHGTITSGGLYTAPATAGSDTVTAKSVQDGTKTAAASITVASASTPPAPTITSVSVSPAVLTLNTGAQSSFTATITGTGSYSYGVTWSCLKGTITSGGLYTAPAAASSDTVTATSVQDGSKTAASSVTISSSSTPSGTSVKSAPYNAYGDGVHDDTAAIQACINACASGGAVAVPAGTYLINPTVGSGVWGLMLHSNMTFAMASGATLQAKGVSSDTYGILCSNGGSNITITGGNIVGERATHTGTGGESGMGIYLNASNVTVSGVNISECWGDGIYICDNSSNITITNCVCNHNRRQGLSITAGNMFLVQNCTFSNTTGTDPQCGIDIEPNGTVPVTGVHITNCQIFNNVGGGVQQGNVGNAASGTLLENCNIYGNGGGGYNDGGIRFVETHDNIIQNNNVHNNLNGGIMLDSNAGIGCPNTKVIGNTVTSNSGWGITASLCNGSVITGNTITGNSGTSFSYDGSTGTYSPNTTQ